MNETILKWALKNAHDHNGRADAKAVIPKVIGELPDSRKDIKSLAKSVARIVSEVNKMPPEKQEEKLLEIAPGLLEKKKERAGLKELPNAKVGKVVTRLPPGVEKNLHAGHAIGFYLNYLYAKKYRGKLILRFEDTNPLKVKKEFYEGIREDLRSIKIKWDEEIIESNNIGLYYKHIEGLIGSARAYACSCEREKIHAQRRDRKECACRGRGIPENRDIWKRMIKDAKEGEFVIRLRGDMRSKDPLMRDPVIARIIDKEHPIQGFKYRVFPSYDFAVAIEDGLKVTHVLRSAEFVQRTPLQNYIRNLLGLKNPETMHYSRINIIGGITKGREIRELIESESTSWDDPRLMSIRALLRRGIVPETFRQMAHEVGLSLAETNIEYDMLAGINRKFIDPIAKRCFFVREPIKVVVKNAPERTVKIPIHPENPKKTRSIWTRGVFWISKEDAKKGTMRLKDLYNIKIINIGEFAEAEYMGNELIRDMKKIQWVPENHIEVNLVVPDSRELKTFKGLGEANMKNFKKGDIIQMERVGFARIDRKRPYTAIFAHR